MNLDSLGDCGEYKPGGEELILPTVSPLGDACGEGLIGLGTVCGIGGCVALQYALNNRLSIY